jgi:hypothetical protein
MGMVAERGKRGGKRRRQRVGLSVVEETRLKEKLLLTFPSAPWVDSTIKRFEDTKADGTTIVYRFHDPKSFPPAADTTPMVRCPECGRIVPPNSLEGGRCMDHQPARLHDAYGSSPSANCIRQLQHFNLRLDAYRLEPESKAALQREIRKFRRKHGQK